MSREMLRYKTLHVTIWDSDRFKENLFLGEVKEIIILINYIYILIIITIGPDPARESGPRRRREHTVVQAGQLLWEVLRPPVRSRGSPRRGKRGRITQCLSISWKMAYIYSSNQKPSAFCTSDYFPSHHIYSGFYLMIEREDYRGFLCTFSTAPCPCAQHFTFTSSFSPAYPVILRDTMK